MCTEAVRELSDFMKQSGKTQQQVARETGLSTSVISQFLRGSYNGNNEETAARVMKYLELAKARASSMRHTCFYSKMRNTENVIFACRYAHARSDISLVYGDAGAGKTTALKYYMENNTGVVMVTANACTSSAISVLQLISRKIGKPTAGKKEALMSSLVEYFRDTYRLIIIDEADHLTLSALQAVRNLNDEAQVGIVLSGNTKIYRQMWRGSRCMEFDQLRTRVIMQRCIQNSYSPEEFRSVFPGLPDTCLTYLIKLAADESLRTAVKTVEIAYDYTENINLETLRWVRKQLKEGL